MNDPEPEAILELTSEQVRALIVGRRQLALQMRRGYLTIIRAIEEEFDIRPAENERKDPVRR